MHLDLLYTWYFPEICVFLKQFKEILSLSLSLSQWGHIFWTADHDVYWLKQLKQPANLINFLVYIQEVDMNTF